MTQPLKHEQYTKAICNVAGVLFGLVNNEPHPDGRRGVLERMRTAIEEVLAEPEPEQPPEMPSMRIEYFVETSNGEDTWCWHPVSFASEVEARCWAFESMTRWQRIKRIKTSYELVERAERG